MEHESFEDDTTAQLMNELFVSVKVDREERPDVDDTYMTAVQLLTRNGGWPLNVWLTAAREPFFGVSTEDLKKLQGPSFSERRFHESFLLQGTVPAGYFKALVLEQARESTRRGEPDWRKR